jgi:hypothetical protein
MTQALREQWLNNAVTSVRGIFHANGFPIPDHIRVSCGFPSKRARSLYRNVGEHFSPDASEDATHQIFISPVLDDSVEVLGVLMHELSHAVTGSSHGTSFKHCVRKVWLEGSLTQTKVGAEFRSNFAPILESLGVYPHAKLNVASNYKPQGTRMLKATCHEDNGSLTGGECGYTIRLSNKWAINSKGETTTPDCPFCKVQLTLSSK